MTWRRDALCARTTVDFFDGPVTQAKAVCAVCPVRPECLTDTMRAETEMPWARYGVAGGLTGEERHRLAEGRTLTHGNTKTDAVTVAEHVARYVTEHGHRRGAINATAAALNLHPNTVATYLRRSAA